MAGSILAVRCGSENSESSKKLLIYPSYSFIVVTFFIILSKSPTAAVSRPLFRIIISHKKQSNLFFNNSYVQRALQGFYGKNEIVS